MKSKFCLQHDVWTSKGNRHGFIGASVTFIDDNWTFVSRHLTLKVVGWKHRGKWLAQPLVKVLHKHGLIQKICMIHLNSHLLPQAHIISFQSPHMLSQTTDSGSNNKTMALEMHNQFSSLVDCDMPWNPWTMHAFCFCHKIALIVGAGLHALGLNPPLPLKIKAAMRGHFPDIVNSIPEQDETIEELDSETGPDGLHPFDIQGKESSSARNQNQEQGEISDESGSQEDEDDHPDLDMEKEIYDGDEWAVPDEEDEDDQVLDLEGTVGPTHRRKSNELDSLLRNVCCDVFPVVICIQF